VGRFTAADRLLVFLDTNILISALKGPDRQTGTLRLILRFLEREDIRLVGNTILLEEYARYIEALPAPTAARLAAAILGKMEVIDPEERHVLACKPYFAAGAAADCVHAATCLQTGALLLSNDRHFDAVVRAGLVRFLRTSEAIRRFAAE